MNLKIILKKMLAGLARRTIRKYNPVVIGVTGSVGKTSTRQAIYTVLKKKYRVRTAEKNYNNEIGLPLAILGIPHHGRNVFKWAATLIGVFLKTSVLIRDAYPEILILEYGVDHPGDMDHLLSIARPTIGVVTAIGDIPVHVEFFKNPEELIHEKTKLIAALPSSGFAILNHDDYAVLDMAQKAVAKTATYGREKDADFQIENYELRTIKDADIGEVPEGISFKIEFQGSVVPFRMHNVFGMPAAYSGAAVAAVAASLGINLLDAAEALKEFMPPAGRLRLLKGIKHSFILDDTYNAAPESMRVALETLKALPAKRKIAVLGDMREIGGYAEEAHRRIGDSAAEFVDLLFLVGPHAKFIADEAMHRGIRKNARELSPGQIFELDDSLAAGRALDPLIQPGDLILVKGSQAMRMEKTVEEIMAEPIRAGELLVRQDTYWKER